MTKCVLKVLPRIPHNWFGQNYTLIFWVTAGLQHIALYWHLSTRQLQCNVWQFNEAVKKIKHFGFGKNSLPGFRSPWLGPIPHFTHLFFELQPVCSTLHSIDIVRHVSFSAMCDNLMRLLGKSMPNLLDRCLGFCKRKLENEFLTETMKISTLTTSRKIPTY